MFTIIVRFLEESVRARYEVRISIINYHNIIEHNEETESIAHGRSIIAASLL